METIEYYHKNSDVVSYRKEIYDDGYWDEKLMIKMEIN